MVRLQIMLSFFFAYN